MIKQIALDRALRRKRAAVEAVRLEAEKRLDKALEIDEIALAYSAYIKAMFRRSVSKENEEKFQTAVSAYQNALKKYGFEQKDFEYPSVCPICGDKGKVGGKTCKCVYDLYIEELEKECDILSRAPFTFDDFDFAGIRDEAQADALKKLCRFSKTLADKLPDVKVKVITLTGAVGTGKTCLASAIARRTVAKGLATMFMSAYEFNALCLRYHTSPIAQRNALFEDVLGAELVVIDDLGTEPMLKNVTVEYLLLVLEERVRRGLVTIFTSNLDADRILQRYGERVYSRLADKRTAQFLRLAGDDLRKK